MLFLARAELCPYLFSSTLYVVVTIPELTHPRDAQRGPSRNRVATEHLSQESRRPAQGDRERAGAGEEPASGEALALWQDGRTAGRGAGSASSELPSTAWATGGARGPPGDSDPGCRQP